MGERLVLGPRKRQTSDGQASGAESLPPPRGDFSDQLNPRGSTTRSSIKPSRLASQRPGGNHLTGTHGLRTGPHHAELVVPSKTVTDTSRPIDTGSRRLPHRGTACRVRCQSAASDRGGGLSLHRAHNLLPARGVVDSPPDRDRPPGRSCARGIPAMGLPQSARDVGDRCSRGSHSVPGA
jgi:hypothetical protein